MINISYAGEEGSEYVWYVEKVEITSISTTRQNLIGKITKPVNEGSAPYTLYYRNMEHGTEYVHFGVEFGSILDARGRFPRRKGE
jgi:hypothetical protein